MSDTPRPAPGAPGPWQPAPQTRTPSPRSAPWAPAGHGDPPAGPVPGAPPATDGWARVVPAAPPRGRVGGRTRVLAVVVGTAVVVAGGAVAQRFGGSGQEEAGAPAAGAAAAAGGDGEDGGDGGTGTAADGTDGTGAVGDTLTANGIGLTLGSVTRVDGPLRGDAADEVTDPADGERFWSLQVTGTNSGDEWVWITSNQCSLVGDDGSRTAAAAYEAEVPDSTSVSLDPGASGDLVVVAEIPTSTEVTGLECLVYGDAVTTSDTTLTWAWTGDDVLDAADPAEG